jgi:N-sulfoglucosamine sulfohydrolase
LYHTAEDVYEMRDLAADAEHADVKARLAAELDRWMTAQGDPGVEQDTSRAVEAARQGRHLFAPPDAP